MKKIIILFLSVTMFGCVKYNGDIPAKYREPFLHYKSGQIIHFKSNLNDFDTLKIEGLDSIEVKSHGPDNLPGKTIFLQASYGLKKYTKKNHFLYDILLRESTGKYDSIGNLQFLNLNKGQRSDQKNDQFSLHVDYRNFSGELNIEKSYDTIRNVFTGKTLDGENFESFGPDWVTEIYWSAKDGLVGYKKEDGQIYSIYKKQ